MTILIKLYMKNKIINLEFLKLLEYKIIIKLLLIKIIKHKCIIYQITNMFKK